MSWLEIKEKQELRAQEIEKAGQILKRAKAENRDMTPEENTEFEQRHAAADKHLDSIQKLQRQVTAENVQNVEVKVGREDMPVENRAIKVADPEKRFKHWLRCGDGRWGSPRQTEERALYTDLDSTNGVQNGAELVPTGFYNNLVTYLRDNTSVLSANPLINRTQNGQPFNMPIFDDTANTGEMIGENTDVGEADPDTNYAPVGSFIFSSKWVKVPLSMVEDAGFPIDTWLPPALGGRITAKLNGYLTTGTGSRQPGGCVTGATQGKVTASPTALTYQEILDLIHSVPVQYRTKNTVLMGNDSTLLAVKKLVDGDGNLLFNWGKPEAGFPSTIAGVPFITNNAMDSIAASKKVLLCGDFSQAMLVRFVRDIELYVARELFLGKLQAGYLSVVRADSLVFDPNGLKYMITHS